MSEEDREWWPRTARDEDGELFCLVCGETVPHYRDPRATHGDPWACVVRLAEMVRELQAEVALLKERGRKHER